MFDFLKNRQYNDNKRVADKRKSSLSAARFYIAKKMSIAMKREELKQNGGKQQDEGNAGG